MRDVSESKSSSHSSAQSAKSDHETVVLGTAEEIALSLWGTPLAQLPASTQAEIRRQAIEFDRRRRAREWLKIARGEAIPQP
jgi:hypothetical protein